MAAQQFGRRVACHRRAVVAGLAAAVVVGSATVAAAAPFPVDEPFGAATTANPHWILSGKARLTAEGDGWLQLNPSRGGSTGTALLDDAFDATIGIVVDVDYAMWGGSTPGGDGFTMFLIDGSRTTAPGGFGGALGYACRGYPTSLGPAGELGRCSSSGGEGVAGVSGGVLGIGFDEYGNFSTGQVGDGPSPGFRPHAVVLRGAGDQTVGFRYLTGTTLPSSLGTGSRAGARHVRLTLIDRKVTVAFVDGTTTTKVIDGYDLALAPDQPPTPPTLKLGFSAASGGATNNEELRNLKVAAPVDLATTTTAPASLEEGQPYAATVTVANAGPNAAMGATLRLSLPAGLDGTTITCRQAAGVSCGTVTTTTSSATLPVTVPAGSTATVDVQGAAARAGTTTLTATVIPPAILTDIDPSNDTSSGATTVAAAPATTTTTTAPSTTTTTGVATTTTTSAGGEGRTLPVTGTTSTLPPLGAAGAISVAVGFALLRRRTQP